MQRVIIFCREPPNKKACRFESLDGRRACTTPKTRGKDAVVAQSRSNFIQQINSLPQRVYGACRSDKAEVESEQAVYLIKRVFYTLIYHFRRVWILLMANFRSFLG